jgi:hypothetical protein
MFGAMAGGPRRLAALRIRLRRGKRQPGDLMQREA